LNIEAPDASVLALVRSLNRQGFGADRRDGLAPSAAPDRPSLASSISGRAPAVKGPFYPSSGLLDALCRTEMAFEIKRRDGRI
jgi:hypothetical protein